MLKKILIASATLVGLLLAIGLVLPSTFRVERSTLLQAPPEAVYPYVANLERWREWGPWRAEKYPGSQWVFGGPQEGVGAVHSWSGGSVGNGTLSLTQADPKTGVAYDMSVEQGRYLVHGRISFAPEGQGTRVTWVDEGDLGGNPFAHYLVPLIRSRLGGYLEEGLAGLAKQVRPGPLPAEAQPEPAPVPVEQAEAPARPVTPPPSESPPAEGAQAPAPVVEGSPVIGSPAVPSVEGSQASDAGEVAPPVAVPPVPAGEAAPASPGTALPSGEPAPAEASPTVPASTPAPPPAPTEGQSASPT
ncbi:polyketide cyclase/dehydrase/lipid transport protein [Archangium gephyra]|uniref:Polyketide cyclase/dehydrase/lipid transport protein n=1 Tax=Archangium gephyra TaxID=48 RepID=A0AAC8QGI9_9BACT|nr:SRPBCC family protein [Archangium gephyra]AKJ07353.1 Vegetative cell wall protein gp1 precursor [Archangium gephyra]REG26754.1 polyketide cyclase/dehydrase/lipid transport protein [Archangium gephyra]